MAGGGNAKKLIIDFVVDNPGKVYLGGAALIYFYRTFAINQNYNYFFGKFDFQRKRERGELKY